jgi:hypothetical protein
LGLRGVVRADDTGAGGAATIASPTSSISIGGCFAVTVNGAPRLVTASGAPCDETIAHPSTVSSVASAHAEPPARRARFAPDDERSGALIASSVVFGVGGALTGVTYLIKRSEDDSRCGQPLYADTGAQTGVDTATCGHPSARASLVLYGAVVGLTPSLPRFVVGDSVRGLVFTALRVAAITTAAWVPWGKTDASWSGPFLLGFAAPVALGIYDLATAPHREQLDEVANGRPRIADVSAAPMVDARGTHGAMIAIGGIF